jgi:hypothetical protein
LNENQIQTTKDSVKDTELLQKRVSETKTIEEQKGVDTFSAADIYSADELRG